MSQMLVPYKKKTTRTRKGKKKTVSLDKRITQVIKRREETKCASIVSGGAAPANNSVKFGQLTLGGGYISGNLYPPMIIGSGPTARVGNECYPSSMNIKYSLFFDGSVPQTIDGPQDVYVMAVSLKGASGLQQSLSLTDLSQLVNAGLTNVPWTGQFLNAMLPINRDYFTVHGIRKHKMSNYIQNNGTAGVATYPYNTASYNHVAQGTIKIKTPKKIIFNDSGNSNFPINASVFLIVGTINHSNTLFTVGTLNALSIDWCSTLYYKEN